MRIGPDLDIDFLVVYLGIHELAFNLQLYEARDEHEHEYRSDRNCGRLGELTVRKIMRDFFRRIFYCSRI